MRQSRQPILRKGDMTHLPADVADTARRHLKPICCWCLIEKPDSVFAGKDDLLNDKLKAGHDYFSFAGNVLTMLLYIISLRFDGACDFG